MCHKTKNQGKAKRNVVNQSKGAASRTKDFFKIKLAPKRMPPLRRRGMWKFRLLRDPITKLPYDFMYTWVSPERMLNGGPPLFLHKRVVRLAIRRERQALVPREWPRTRVVQRFRVVPQFSWGH